jgi:uncharacterized short protein YbdD (DUF466 family)
MIAASKVAGAVVTRGAPVPAPARTGAVAAIARVIKQIIGVPDYERYVEHQCLAHPGCEPLSREAFMRDRLEARYNRPGSKCC